MLQVMALEKAMVGEDLGALQSAIKATELHNSKHPAATIELESAKTRLGKLGAHGRGRGKAKGKGKQKGKRKRARRTR